MRFLLLFLLLPFVLHAAEKDGKQKLAPIHHIIVFYLENHTFDNLLGTFPGADGLANAGNKAVQVDADGKPYVTLPHAMVDHKPDPRFPEKLPNEPFLISQYVPAQDATGDLLHRFYQNIDQINNGAMNKFALVSDAGALTMGYYTEEDLPLWQYARAYTLADHFFVGAYGGSLLNHFWLICACTPRYENAPEKIRAVLDDKGHMVRDGALSPDGYAVNNIQPFSLPYDPKASDPATRLPLQTLPTIGDRLSEKGINWAWYGGEWDDAVAGKLQRFPYHHHPFPYFANYAAGTKGRKEHLKDEKDFITGIEQGKLPPVTFFKPSARYDLHPGYSKLKESEVHVFDLINKIEKSPLWKDSLIIVTFDDAGGYWDHVPPPQGRPLRPRRAHPHADYLPLRQTRLRRSHDLRHHIYSEADRNQVRHQTVR